MSPSGQALTSTASPPNVKAFSIFPKKERVFFCFTKKKQKDFCFWCFARQTCEPFSGLVRLRLAHRSGAHIGPIRLDPV
jgi:hypothetical protein